MDKKLLFTFKDLTASKTDFIVDTYKSYLAKFEAIAKNENETIFNNECLIFFGKRKVPPTDGRVSTLVSNSVVICFPKTNVDAIKQTFTDLLNKLYTEAIKTEKDDFKLQTLPSNFHLKVKFFTAFMLNQKEPPVEAPVLYADCNENGISYNLQNVIIIT